VPVLSTTVQHVIKQAPTKSRRVWDTKLGFSGAVYPSTSAKGPPQRIDANKGLHSFLYHAAYSRGHVQQKLGHKLPSSCSFSGEYFYRYKSVASDFPPSPALSRLRSKEVIQLAPLPLQAEGLENIAGKALHWCCLL